MNDDQMANPENTDLKSIIEELEEQLSARTAERDLLAVMLIEADNVNRRNELDTRFNRDRSHAAGEFEYGPARTPANRRITVAQLLKLIEELSPEEREQVKKYISKGV